MNRILLSLVLFCSVPALLLSGCGDSTVAPEELIAKSWSLKKFSMKDEMVPPTMIANASFTFTKDGNYEILLGSLDRGTWKFSEDKKVLITTNTDSQQESHIDVAKLTADELILVNNVGPKPVRMELVPVQ